MSKMKKSINLIPAIWQCSITFTVPLALNRCRLCAMVTMMIITVSLRCEGIFRWNCFVIRKLTSMNGGLFSSGSSQRKDCLAEWGFNGITTLSCKGFAPH